MVGLAMQVQACILTVKATRHPSQRAFTDFGGLADYKQQRGNDMKLPETITQHFHIVLSPNDFVTLSSISMGDDDGWVDLGEIDITINVPQIDVTGKRIRAMEKVKAKLVTDHADKLAVINTKIQELRALSFGGES